MRAPESPTEIWIHDDRDNGEAYQQVFAFQFALKYLEAFADLETCLREGARPPALLILDTDHRAATPAAEWLARFHAAFGGRSKAIVVTKNDSLERFRELGLAGAADVILKPLKPNELIFRCERAISESLGGPLEILPASIEGVSVTGLTFKERQLLAIFILAPEHAVRRSDLFGAVWKDISVNKKTLDVHLFNLRRKLHPFGFDIVSRTQLYQLQKL